MKIALVSQEYPPETSRGGIGSQAYTKANGMVKRGHRVYVISRSSNDVRSEHKINGVHVIRIPGLDRQLPEMTEPVQTISHSTLVAIELYNLHKKVDLNIIEFPEWSAEGYVFMLNQTPWNTVPVVIHLHGPMVMLAHTIGWPPLQSPYYETGTHMEAMCLNLAHGIYSSSNCSAEWVKKHYLKEKGEIPTIHTGVDVAKFCPNEKKYSRPTVVFAGRLVKSKGVEDLVKAAVLASKFVSNMQLRLVGKGEESFIKRLKEIAESAGASSLLKFDGFVEREHLPAHLARAHLFAAPSHYEGGPGFVYLEAMACGLPVIACSGSGVEEIVEHHRNGLLVPPRDVEAISEAIIEMLREPETLSQMGIYARNYIIEHADTEKCLQKIERFYSEVIHKHDKMKSNESV